ncbi:MAG: hypothetical protein AAFX55_21100 [Bacteroidota bacterium]
MTNEMYNNDEILTYLSMDSEEILVELGDELTEDSGLGAIPKSRQELKTMGNAWFEKNKKAFCGSIKKSDFINEYISGTSQVSKVELVAAVLDVVSSVAKGYSVFLASILIVKYGVTKTCLNDSLD